MPLYHGLAPKIGAKSIVFATGKNPPAISAKLEFIICQCRKCAAALIGSFFLSPRFSLALGKEPGEGGPIQRHTQKASYQWGYSYILERHQLIPIIFKFSATNKTCRSSARAASASLPSAHIIHIHLFNQQVIFIKYF